MNNQQSTSISRSAHWVSIRTFPPLIHSGFVRLWVSPDGIDVSPSHQHPDVPHALVLLRTRRERRNELPPFHSITSSARARKVSGIVTPIAFAVLRLTTSWNLVGYWTGSSPGFAPRRMRST
jgi:hypothetical protein